MESLCSAYHWTFDQIFKLTIPQILMMNHAADVNRKRSGLDDIGKDSDVETFRGKPVDELSSEEYAIYLNEGL